MEVYFIATYRDLKRNEQGWLDTGGGRRVVGFYQSFEKADKAVRENWGSIYEDGYYKYAVIECCEEGLYPFCTKPVFYKWVGDKTTGGYKKINRPKAANGFFGFTIG